MATIRSRNRFGKRFIRLQELRNHVFNVLFLQLMRHDTQATCWFAIIFLTFPNWRNALHPHPQYTISLTAMILHTDRMLTSL